MQITTIQYPIRQIHQANLITIGKYKPLEDIDWRKVDLHQLLLAEHSTLEWAPIYIYAPTRKDVTSHIVRHTKQHPRFVVQSGRPDWTGKERPPHDAQTLFMTMVNPLSLINMAKQRLCFKAMKETREWMESIVKELYAPSPGSLTSQEQKCFFESLARVLVPACVHRGACCERKGCGRYESKWKAGSIVVRYQQHFADLVDPELILGSLN